MTRRRIAALVLTMLVCTVLVGAAAVGAWLVYTQSGLVWLTTRVVGIAGKGLTLDGVAGTLAGGASIEAIRYAGEDIELRVREAYVRVSPWSLILLEPRIAELRAAELAVVTKPTEPRGRPPDTLELPADFALPDARVAKLVIDLGKGPIELTDVHLDYDGGKTRHDINSLTLAGYEHTVRLKGRIDARAPFALEATAHIDRAAIPKATADVKASGNLSELTIEGTAGSGEARVKASARAEPYAKFPLAAIQAHIEKLDLRAFVKELPRTAIEGDIELVRKGVLLAGPVRLTNAAAGPYDKGLLPVAALRMNVVSDTAKETRFEVAADLGRGGAISGSGEVRGETAQLALTARGVNLQALHTQMRETKLGGRAQLALTQARQSVRADLTQDGISLALHAERAGERIEVPQFRATARGGEASGSGRVELAGRKPFALDAMFVRFDPAAWGSFPGGSINGTVSAKGSIEGPEVDVVLAIRDSRWLDAPLEANGALSLSRERVRVADLNAAIGGNRVSGKGALGLPQDTLALTIDAPKLGVFDKRVQGAIRGSAQLAGALRAPAVRFDLTGANLAHTAYGQVQAIEARGALGTDAAGALQIDATVRGLNARELKLASARLRLDGTRASHAGTLQARGERIDFRMQARGGWRAAAGWTGTIEELVNSGEAAASLSNPVAVSVGPQRVIAEPFELRLIGGRLQVSALRYEKGRLTTAGRFSELPVRPLIAIAGGPAAMAGTLRLNGEWNLENAPQIRGSISIVRESGDVALGAERTLPLGIQTLALNATFTPQSATFQAQLKSAIATANAEGRILTVGSGGNARYGAASPLAFTATADIARLAPFAAFIDTTMLLDGELHAKLQGSGTLGQPNVVGPITGEKIALALPAEGVELKGGTLKAALTQREIRVESFSIRGGEGVFDAQGTLARTGYDEASVDWRAERFTVLARPDRRLVVSGKGNAALKGGKLAFTGNLRANEGLIELATTTLPTLGDDVVVVGRPGAPATVHTEALPPASGRRATRASVDMSIELGNNVHLTGRGLDVWLSGDVRVTTDALGVLRAVGTVDARRGTFEAYGQRLEIDRGRFFFNGPITNPGLDILAMRKRQAVEAGVAVTGTMSRPVVRVVSNPPLPEGEALSWLVLGRAPDQAGAGQLSALPLATTALLGNTTSGIAKKLHLDEVGVRGGAAAQQYLTVGKRLTERIYVAIEQSLGGTENLLRLEMSLTQRIALRAQAGTTSSLGVFYRYSWD